MLNEAITHHRAGRLADAETPTCHWMLARHRLADLFLDT
jgi:hypothetical protein